MAYQIKSTPFFRRILTTSKKNGQLQRLKEEYERMKEFNDRAIEMKMRQVRLKRLFKEIEEIKESSTQYSKRSRATPKTTQEIRQETFKKAKELGKEYSKMNALTISSNGNKLDNFGSIPSAASKLEPNKKQMIAKAVRYGNESSMANLEKLTHAPRKKIIKPVPKSKSSVSENQEKLKQRISYGNSRSSINMAKVLSRRHARSSNSGIDAAPNKSLTTRVKIATQSTSEEDEMRRYGDMMRPADSDIFHSFEHGNDGGSRALDLRNDDSMAHMRAMQHWRKVALTVRHRFDTRKGRELLPLDQSEEVEFRLHNSDNGMDLTQDSDVSELSVATAHGDPLTEALSSEVLLNVQPLYDPVWANVRNYPPPVPPKPVAEQTLAAGNKPVDGVNLTMPKSSLAPSEKVQKLAKIFEPFVREAAQKEVFDGVRKLKSIFEHQ